MVDLDPVTTFADLLRRSGSMTEAEIENAVVRSGRVVAGASEAQGEDRAVRAAQTAIAPLLTDASIKQAGGILVEIVTGDKLTDSEINAAGEAIRQVADPNTEMLIGDLRDESMAGAVRVTVILIGTEVRA
jgi:cell division protein FtsZ